MIVLAMTCLAACHPMYVMDGTKLSPVVTDSVVADAARIMQGMRVNLSVSEEIADQPETAEVWRNKRFILDPRESLDVASEYLKGLGCLGDSCRQMAVHVKRLVWAPEIIQNSGFWMPVIYLEIDADREVAGETESKVCWVSGGSPTRFWSTNENLSESLRIAVKHAFVRGLACVVDDNSHFNEPDRAKYMAKYGSPL